MDMPDLAKCLKWHYHDCVTHTVVIIVIDWIVVHLIKVKLVCIQANCASRPELIPVSVV